MMPPGKPLFSPVFCLPIQADNCQGLCSEETCGKHYTQYTILAVNGLRLNIGFCDQHAEEFEKVGWRSVLGGD